MPKTVRKKGPKNTKRRNSVKGRKSANTPRVRSNIRSSKRKKNPTTNRKRTVNKTQRGGRLFPEGEIDRCTVVGSKTTRDDKITLRIKRDADSAGNPIGHGGYPDNETGDDESTIIEVYNFARLVSIARDIAGIDAALGPNTFKDTADGIRLLNYSQLGAITNITIGKYDFAFMPNRDNLFPKRLVYIETIDVDGELRKAQDPAGAANSGLSTGTAFDAAANRASRDELVAVSPYVAKGKWTDGRPSAEVGNGWANLGAAADAGNGGVGAYLAAAEKGAHTCEPLTLNINFALGIQ